MRNGLKIPDFRFLNPDLRYTMNNSLTLVLVVSPIFLHCLMRLRGHRGQEKLV